MGHPTRNVRPQVDARAPAPAIRVETFGGFRLTVIGRTASEYEWRRRPARQLFKCLLSRPRHRVTRDLLVEWLWPNSDVARGTLRSTVHALRRTLSDLGVESAIDVVIVDRDAITLAATSDIWVDADEFERLLMAARASNDPLALLEQADRLYLGEYLPEDLYEDWAADRREALKRAWTELQFLLAQHRERQNDPDGAASALQRLLDVDHCDERAAQELIRLFVRHGRRSEAARVHQRLTQALRDDLGVEPSASIVALGHDLSGPSTEPALARATLWTFLLTDIEESVPFWERDAQAMQQALARHDTLIDEGVTRRAGAVVHQHGEGDSRFIVFAHARDAVAAACDLQLAFEREPWSTATPLRVRMALHTGEAVERAGYYYGSAVNRCARLRGLGHGGQVLLSEATAALVRNDLPDGTGLRDLAEHHLRGFERPERVYQLLHPELQTDFPPLVGSARRQTNLPTPTAPLIGRDEEIASVCALFRRDDVRLVTLTGAGGVGKTRLGLQVATDLLDQFSDGVFFVSLAPTSDPTLVLSTIAQALRLRDTGRRPIKETLETYLTDKQVLLLLDNFEQVLPAAPIVSELLSSCSRLKIMVTSRAVLNLTGEREFLVYPLPYPDPNHSLPLQGLSRYAAVALFVQRAVGVQSEFALTEESAPAVAEICRRVDGLPLAIELAAARVRLLPPHVILTRMERPLPLLTGGARDLPERQRTLRDTMAWSYDLLDKAEQQLFRRLAVFEAGWTLEAAEAVCGADSDPGASVLDSLASLVTQSLVQQHESAPGERRFTMLHTIREYALEHLDASGEAETIRGRHASYFLAVAETAGPELWGHRQLSSLARLERDHDNVRVALGWLIQRGEATLALRLAGAMGRFWEMRGRLNEGRQQLARALALPCEPTIERSRALNAAAALAIVQGDTGLSLSLAKESLKLSSSLGDARERAGALTMLGIAAYYRTEHESATELLQSGLATMRELEDLSGMALALTFLGNVAHVQGANAEARRYHDEGLALRRRVGDRRGIALSLHALATVARAQGRLDEATALLHESLALCRAVDEPMGLAMALSTLGNLALEGGDHGRAAQLQRASLELRRVLADRRGIAWCLVGLAGVALAQEQPRRAARWLGSAQSLRESAGAPLARISRDLSDGAATEARAQLGDAAFDEAWEEGQAMTLEDAVKHALDATNSPPGAEHGEG